MRQSRTTTRAESSRVFICAPSLLPRLPYKPPQDHNFPKAPFDSKIDNLCNASCAQTQPHKLQMLLDAARFPWLPEVVAIVAIVVSNGKKSSRCRWQHNGNGNGATVHHTSRTRCGSPRQKIVPLPLATQRQRQRLSVADIYGLRNLR